MDALRRRAAHLPRRVAHVLCVAVLAAAPFVRLALRRAAPAAVAGAAP